MTLWILVIYLYGYEAPPVVIEQYRSLAKCKVAGQSWEQTGTPDYTRRAWACIPNR